MHFSPNASCKHDNAQAGQPAINDRHLQTQSPPLPASTFIQRIQIQTIFFVSVDLIYFFS